MSFVGQALQLAPEVIALIVELIDWIRGEDTSPPKILSELPPMALSRAIMTRERVVTMKAIERATNAVRLLDESPAGPSDDSSR